MWSPAQPSPQPPSTPLVCIQLSASPASASPALDTSWQQMPVVSLAAAGDVSKAASAPAASGWWCLVDRARGLVARSASGSSVGSSASGGSATPACQRALLFGVCVVFRLTDGQEVVAQAPDDVLLADLKCWFTAKTGVPAQRMRVVVHEVAAAADDYSIANFARSVSRGGLAAGRAAADWARFLLLPEAVNRELRGDGLLQWSYRRLMLSLKALRSAGQGGGGGGGVVQVASLGGGVAAVLDAGARVDVASLRAAVEREAGVPAARQRLVIYEEKERGVVQRLALRGMVRCALFNLSLALAWVELARALLAAPAALRGTGRTGATAEVRVQVGAKDYTLTLPENTTLRQVAQAVARHEAQWVVTRVC